jgi:hypothetical protein
MTSSYHGYIMPILVQCLFNISYHLKNYANPIMTCFFLKESLNYIVIKPRTFSYHGHTMPIPAERLFNISYHLKNYANPVIMTCFF